MNTSTQLLVSVRSVEEAVIALDSGVDIIDVKEPVRGSLGKPSAAVVNQIVTTVQSKIPISVALGEWHQAHPRQCYQGVTWVKVGLSKLRPPAWLGWLRLQQQLLPSRLLGVVYADHVRVHGPNFERMIDWMKQASNTNSPHRPGILIDTAIKDGQGLLHWYSVKQLQDFREACQQAGLFLALAGSLTMKDVKLISRELQPDIIAVRGLVCVGNARQARVESDRVQSLVQCLRASC